MKMSTQITIFFIAFNAMAAVVMGMGVAEELGVNVETGSPERIEQIGQQDRCPNNQASKDECASGVDLGNNVGGTLFGMYNRLTQQVGAIFYSLTPGFAMLKVFLPDIWIDAFLSPIAVVIVTKDMIAFARGTEL